MSLLSLPPVPKISNARLITPEVETWRERTWSPARVAASKNSAHMEKLRERFDQDVERVADALAKQEMNARQIRGSLQMGKNRVDAILRTLRQAGRAKTDGFRKPWKIIASNA